MSPYSKISLVAAALWIFAGCTAPEKPNANPDQGTDKEMIPETPVINSYSGVVSAVRMGKDGYTATLKTIKDGEIIFATISRANLNLPKTYKQAEAGDTLRVIGDQWQLEDETHLTVRELK